MSKTMYGLPVFVVVDAERRPMAVFTTEGKADNFIEYLTEEYKQKFTHVMLAIDPVFGAEPGDLN